VAKIRVIGGEARGRRLLAVPGEETRPVGDRVKEALFNILGQQIEGAMVLDLFAGTGSVGIEALSRGASHCVFVDSSARAVRTIARNLEITHFKENATIHRGDAFGYLGRRIVRQFDMVYIAPPQYQGLWQRAIEVLDERVEWLHPDAVLIAQMHPKEYRPLVLKNLVEYDQRRYGSTLLVFIEFPGS
jgi:16S rRNA (guanine966-N2)-methyltransferase